MAASWQKSTSDCSDFELARTLQLEEDRKRRRLEDFAGAACARRLQAQEHRSTLESDEAMARAQQHGSSHGSSAANFPGATTPHWPAMKRIQLAQQSMEDASARADGLLPLLCAQYLPGGKWATRATAAVAEEPCPLYTQKGVEDGSDHWSCGYRNIQMICASLLGSPELAPALFGGLGFVPRIGDLQGWIEHAWEQGFDTAGRRQLGGVRA